MSQPPLDQGRVIDMGGYSFRIPATPRLSLGTWKGILAALVGAGLLFTTYYQSWQRMKCAPECDGACSSGDPVGHPNASGYNKVAYGGTGSTYVKTFESVVRRALPPRPARHRRQGFTPGAKPTRYHHRQCRPSSWARSGNMRA